MPSFADISTESIELAREAWERVLYKNEGAHVLDEGGYDIDPTACVAGGILPPGWAVKDGQLIPPEKTGNNSSP